MVAGILLICLSEFRTEDAFHFQTREFLWYCLPTRCEASQSSLKHSAWRNLHGTTAEWRYQGKSRQGGAASASTGTGFCSRPYVDYVVTVEYAIVSYHSPPECCFRIRFFFSHSANIWPKNRSGKSGIQRH